MLRKFAVVGILALCSLATGCWFNSPCCSPYDKAGPTFGDDPSIPNDFNYRKGSILGSETPSGGQYNDGGVEYVPDDGSVSDYVEGQPQPVAQYTQQQQSDVQYTPQPQPVAQYTRQPRRFPGLYRFARPMNQDATYQGVRDQDAGYPRSGSQGASTYRTGTNPRYRSQGNYDGFDEQETEFQNETE